MPATTKTLNLIPGTKYNDLTVLEKDLLNKECRWKFQCTCGVIKSLAAPQVVKGSTQSCGCKRNLSIATARRKTIKHGCSRQKQWTTEYNIWISMRKRCYYKNCSHYQYYGGRGITVCTSWYNSFETFLSDMGKRPSVEYSIDRIDNNGNYEPSNCRWATKSEQALNKRNTIKIEFNGELKTIKQIAEISGLNDFVIRDRYANGLREDDLVQPLRRKVTQKRVS